MCYKGIHTTHIVLKKHSFLTPFKPTLNNRIDLTISFNSKKYTLKRGAQPKKIEQKKTKL
jgi:hypothetical protein